MTSPNKNVAIIVHACDRYEFLYKGFDYFFSKYWDFDINCNYYFATEEKNAVVHGFKNIKSGKGEWADRLAILISEKVSEKYILYFQEDMWLNKKVNAKFFNHLFELAERNNWQHVKLHSFDAYKTIDTGLYIEGFHVTKLNNNASDFLMSHQVTLWDKDVLLQQLHKKEHPWRNERKGTKRLKKLNPEIYQIDYFAENGKKEINKNNNPVLRSEYQTISVNGVLNTNVEPYIKELMQGDAEAQQYASKLEHNLKNNVTHDGKPKPRKVDIFKRTKNWIKGK